MGLNFDQNEQETVPDFTDYRTFTFYLVGVPLMGVANNMVKVYWIWRIIFFNMSMLFLRDILLGQLES